MTVSLVRSSQQLVFVEIKGTRHQAEIGKSYATVTDFMIDYPSNGPFERTASPVDPLEGRIYAVAATGDECCEVTVIRPVGKSGRPGENHASIIKIGMSAVEATQAFSDAGIKVGPTKIISGPRYQDLTAFFYDFPNNDVLEKAKGDFGGKLAQRILEVEPIDQDSCAIFVKKPEVFRGNSLSQTTFTRVILEIPVSQAIKEFEEQRIRIKQIFPPVAVQPVRSGWSFGRLFGIGKAAASAGRAADRVDFG